MHVVVVVLVIIAVLNEFLFPQPGLQKARDILAVRGEVAEKECQEHFLTHQLTEKLKKEG